METFLHHARWPRGIHRRPRDGEGRRHLRHSHQQARHRVDFSGYLSVDKFSFTINLPIEGSPADVTFSGTFDGTSLKGSISVQGISLDFTGVKPSAASSTMVKLRGAQ